MNAEEFLEVIRARRSIRRFRAEPVGRALIERLIEHAAWAPSAGNRQDWTFLVVTRAELRRALGDAVARRWAEVFVANRDCGGIEEIERHAPYFSAFAAAPVVIAVACREEDEFQRQLLGPDAEAVFGGTASAAMAAQNLMLAAQALGLGSCCFTGALAARSELGQLLGLPRRCKLVCLIGVGVPAERPAPPPRKPLAEIVRFVE